MKKEFIRILIAVLFLQAFFNATEGAPKLYVDFRTTNSSIDSLHAPAKDSIFTAAIYVSDIENLYGYQFCVLFDTTRLRFISASKATSSANNLMGTDDQFFFHSNLSLDRNNKILIAASLLGQIPGVSGSGYLGVITFQRLTSDTTAIILTDPIFINRMDANIQISSLSKGLLLPPGSISIKQKNKHLSDYSIQISNRTIKITSPAETPVQVRLLDVSGRSVFEKKNIVQRFSFNIPQVSSGVYMLSIASHIGSIAYPFFLK